LYQRRALWCYSAESTGTKYFVELVTTHNEENFINFKLSLSSLLLTQICILFGTLSSLCEIHGSNKPVRVFIGTY